MQEIADMLIYEFVCDECGHEFEKILSFSAASPACASCGAGNVERQMGRPAIHFKGSGWYINDSKKGKKDSNNPASAADGENGKETESGDAEGVKEKDSASDNGSGSGSNGETKSTDSSSKEKPASKESTSSPAKTEAA
jgi:putative FmdB family regulatory protein